MKRVLVFLLISFYCLSSLFSETLNLPTNAEVEQYYKWWRGQDGNKGADAPGYISNFTLPEDVDLGDGGSKEGAVVRMIPNGEPSDFPAASQICVSTDEALGYGMLIAVMNDDQTLFNKLLRVAEYYKTDDSRYPNLTSWVIPAEQDSATWDQSTEYKAFAKKEKEVKDAGGTWIANDSSSTIITPTQLLKSDNGWGILKKPKFENGAMVGQFRQIPDDADSHAGELTVSSIAMDGALDIAMALYMAHHKWVYDGTHEWAKNDTYGYIGKSLARFKDISGIIDEYGIHKSLKEGTSDTYFQDYFLPTGNFPYDNSNDLTRPCDWILSSFRAAYEGAGEQLTRRIIGAIQSQMEHLESTDNDGVADTGLVADFCEFNKNKYEAQKLVPTYSKKNGGSDFVAGETDADHWYMNAARYPARMAMDYIMYGDEYSLDKAVDILRFSKEKAYALPLSAKPNIDDYTSEDDFNEAMEKYTDQEVARANAFFAPKRTIAGADTDTSYENQLLKAALMMTIYALDKSGDSTYNEVFNTFTEPFGWSEKFTDSFVSDYADFWQELKYKDKGGVKHTWKADFRKDPAHNGYFEDTWTMLALNVMNGDWVRPHVWPNELEDSNIQWTISKGSGYAELTVNDNELVIKINNVPSNTNTEGNEFDITLKATNFDSKPLSGFVFDLNIDRSTTGSSKILAELTYPGFPGNDPKRMREPMVLERNYRMHKFGMFDGQKETEENKSIIKKQNPAELKIGLNSGLKSGTVIKLSNIGLFDPPGEVERYRYVGQWRSDRKYKKYDYVRYHHNTYQCIKDIDGGNDNNPEVAVDSWEMCDYNLIGTKWKANTFYYDGDLVHFEGRTYIARTSFTSVNEPPYAEAVWMLYYDSLGKMGVSDWYAGAYFRIGDYVTYKGNAYKCIAPHKSISSWDPVSAFTLWEKCNSIFVKVKPPVWETWTEYTTGSYAVFNDTKYRCVIGHTSQPGWDPVSIPTLWVVE